MAGREQHHEIEIDATADAVWNEIASGEGLKRWLAEDAKVTDGVEGQQWVSWGQGQEMAVQHLVWQPGERLQLGQRGDDLSGWDALVMDWTIESKGGKAILRLCQSGMPETPDWDDTYDSTTVGWRLFFAAIKHGLEQHAGKTRRTIFRSGPVEAPRDGAWKKFFAEFDPKGELEGLGVGDRYSTTTSTGASIEGRVVLHDPGRNFSVTIDGYDNALMSVDFGGLGASCYVNFILSTFDWSEEQMKGIEGPWVGLLDRLLPVPAPAEE